MKERPVQDWILEKGEPIVKERSSSPEAEIIVEILDSWDPEDEDRRALEMLYWEGLTYLEIAKEFGLADRPSGYYRVARAKRRLRTEYEQRTGGTTPDNART